MNKFKLDEEIKSFANKEKTKDVPSFFSNGIDDALSKLPERAIVTKKERTKKKWGWLYAVAATGVLTTGILGSGFASPAMAELLTKVPGLGYIYQATYEDVSSQKPIPNTISGSQFSFGEKGPFNSENIEVKTFSGYTDQLKNYINFQIPELSRENGEVFVKVDKFGEGQYEITAFGEVDKEPVTLAVIPNPLNLPTFEGSSIGPVVKENVDIHGIKADVLTYQFSETDETNQTSYVVWKRDETLYILASALTSDKLVDFAKKVDNQAIAIQQKQ
ncbi:hypothetical protein IMZ08_14250 [Bacillus luteolus]|uniref:DUF4367 domain-containing protein n=1 Tax=Litchfieldia luteola TaxID=682179 RepID=A0ABR9QM05_9BACI|nr:hypothetical protein [Cytobacillus luteolus]MBE4909224.1 hypothetical protein [Cytobacillus luteolus]MBP1940319.1 hypothetical protein [Cytobacillus luteolus]